MSEFYLKILSGNHLGAEIPLEPGRYSLGKDQQCDLILTDASLNDIELIIEISDDGQIAIANSGDDTLFLNGMPGDGPLTPQPFDIITTNSLYIALGPAEANWPDLPLPELLYPEQPAPPTSDGTEESNEDDPIHATGKDNDFPEAPEDIFEEDDQYDDIDLDLEDDFDEQYSEDEFEDEDDDDDFENPLANIDKKWLFAIPLLLLTIIIVPILLNSEPEPSVEETRSQLSYLEHAQEIQELLKFKKLKFKELPDKSLLVSGYTDTLNNKQTLMQELRERGIPFTSQVVAMSELRANADNLLKTKGYTSLSLELDTSPGSLILTGYVGSSDELTKIINMLKQEIHGLIAIVDQVENQAGRLNTLKSILREKGLSHRIHLIQKPNLISLEGRLLDDEQVYNLNEVVTRFRKRFGNNPVLKVATKNARSTEKVAGKAPSSSLNIRAVSMGRVPYVILEDGAKYLIGAKLENGYIIEDINLDYLLLNKGTDRIKFRLGGNRDGQKSKQ